MITLTKGQTLKDNPDLEVMSPSGTYDENDLIECGPTGTQEVTCMFEAVYVQNGHEAYDETVLPT